jgi:RNA-directed DNA polymerase
LWESERLIVPLKPGNAGGGKGPYFWVLVEGTKGEEIGVSLATPNKIRRLQRKLYLKAKEEPEFRFYLLYDKVYRDDILAHAWALARHNRGAAGVDGVTFGDIEAQGLQQWLSGLGEELRQETYKPSAVRRVMIPKPGGGERPLGIPTIRDRVVQTAAKLVLEPIFEADFEPCAYGYRPGRSALDAVKEVHETLREGYTDVVDADLSGYFDTIPHTELMRSVARRVVDRRMLRLVKLFLKAPVQSEDGQGRRRMTGGKGSKRGCPQGGVLSPLLSNIYMHRFLRAWRLYGKGEQFKARIVNYAILSRGHAAEALAWTRAVMDAIGLTLNEDKTNLVAAGKDTFDFLGYTFGPAHSRRTGRLYQSHRPSAKSVARIKQRVRAALRPGNMQPWPVVMAHLNRILRGWVSYFRLGARSLAWRAVQNYVLERVRAFLRRRHKVTTHGNRRFTADRIFGELGVLQLSMLKVAAI